MKWTIHEIREYPEDVMPFEGALDLAQALRDRTSRVLDAEPVTVDGYFTAYDHEVIMHAQAQTVLTLPSTRTLDPVQLPLDFTIKERYVYPEHEGDPSDYEEVTILLEEDYLDLADTLVDSVLVNIPHKVIGPDESDDHLPHGKDWEVITEEDYNRQQAKAKEEAVDPRFAELQSLLNESESEDK